MKVINLTLLLIVFGLTRLEPGSARSSIHPALIPVTQSPFGDDPISAGPDQVVPLGRDTLLTGSAPTGFKCSWDILASPVVALIQDRSRLRTVLETFGEGDYWLMLVCSDGKRIYSDDVIIHIFRPEKTI